MTLRNSLYEALRQTVMDLIDQGFVSFFDRRLRMDSGFMLLCAPSKRSQQLKVKLLNLKTHQPQQNQVISSLKEGHKEKTFEIKCDYLLSVACCCGNRWQFITETSLTCMKANAILKLHIQLYSSYLQYLSAFPPQRISNRSSTVSPVTLRSYPWRISGASR